ncbi:hypothetical protein H8356DRAFT_893932, partial [Neocallimastix lanati (nom. inval.)]
MTVNTNRIPKKYVHKFATTEKSVTTESYSKNDPVKSIINPSHSTSISKPKIVNITDPVIIKEKKKSENYDSNNFKRHNNHKVENIASNISDKSK